MNLYSFAVNDNDEDDDDDDVIVQLGDKQVLINCYNCYSSKANIDKLLLSANIK